MLQSAPQLLTYFIELLNHGQKSAGRSNAAYAASGASLPGIESARATLLAQGVELQWTPVSLQEYSSSRDVIRIVRTLEAAPQTQTQTQTQTQPVSHDRASALLGKKSPDPAVQTLEVAIDAKIGDPGRALDKTARFGVTYHYQLQRVQQLRLDGHAIELLGPPAALLPVVMKDIFPPATPQQLAAIADSFSHAIDLSWSASPEPDLAGYVVYRREANSSAGPERVSGDLPLVTPSFHDAGVRAGTAYAYSVTAVDEAGNESQHSEEARETLASQ